MTAMMINNLFGEPVKVIELHEGAERIISFYRNCLNRQMEREQMAAILMDLRVVFRGCHFVFFNSNGVRSEAPAAFNAMRKTGGIVKKECVEFLAYFISDPRNIKAYFDLLDKPVRELWIEILQSYWLPYDSVADVLGKGQTREKRSRASYYYYQNYVSWASWFYYFDIRGYYSSYGTDHIYFSMLSWLRHAFAMGILPEGWSVDESEPTDGEVCFNAEEEMTELIPVIGIMSRNGQLQMSQSKLTEATVKRISAASGIKEFFDSADKGFATLRSTLMLNFFAITMSSNRPETSLYGLYCTFKRAIANNPVYFYSLFGRNIRGLSTKYRKSRPDKFCDLLVDTLRISGRDRLITVDEFIKDVIITDSSNSMCLFELADINYCDIENKLTERSIDVDDFVQEISTTFVRGYIALLASLGAAEVYFHQPARNAASYFGSFTHFRLTELGEFMLGFRDKYTMKVASESKFMLSPENFIITLGEEKNLLAGVLSSMAESIGGGRYRTSEALMLKGCSSADDIRTRYDFFRKSSTDVPPNWESFFKKLIGRCNPLMRENIEQFEMFSISPDNTDLQQLLCSDPILSSLVVRAEGFRILVPSDSFIRFKERLIQLGYLL